MTKKRPGGTELGSTEGPENSTTRGLVPSRGPDLRQTFRPGPHAEKIRDLDVSERNTDAIASSSYEPSRASPLDIQNKRLRRPFRMTNAPADAGRRCENVSMGRQTMLANLAPIGRRGPLVASSAAAAIWHASCLVMTP